MNSEGTLKANAFFETAFLFLFAVYLFIQTIWTTTLEFTIPAYWCETMEAGLLGLIFAKSWASDAKAQKLRYLCAGGIAFVYMAVAYNRNANLLLLALLCIAVRGVDFKKIAGVYLIVKSVILAFSVVCSQIGISTNYVYEQKGREIREALGSSFPTDFAANILFLILVYVYVRGKKIRWSELATITIAACLCYYKTNARNNFICMLLLCAMLSIMKLAQKNAWLQTLVENNAAILKAVTFFFMPLLAWLSVALAAFYTRDNQIFEKLDQLFSYRFSFGTQALEQYGISLFGQPIQERGAGMGASGALAGKYFFLDSSYVRILIIDGLAVFLVMLCIYSYIVGKMCSGNNWVGMIVITIVSLAAFSEHHLLDLYYNPFTLLILAKSKELHNCET